MKGILEYNFDLKVHFNLQKMSLTFWMKENSEEYICPHKEAFESLKVYFAQRVNLVGFHETYTAIKKIGKGNFASVTKSFLFCTSFFSQGFFDREQNYWGSLCG